MKKIIALLLAFVMMLPVAAFAAAGDSTETVIADYKMDSSEGWSAGNLAMHTDPTQGTYFTAASSNRYTFSLNQSASEGVIVVEYDFNNLANRNGGNYNTVALRTSDSSVTLKQHATWNDTGKWVHYKHEVDLDAGTITTYKGADTTGETVLDASLTNGFEAISITIDSWHTMGFGIDNLVVTNIVGAVGPCYVTEAAFEGNDGLLSTEISELKNGVAAVQLSFSKKMVQDTVLPSLSCGGSPVEFESIWLDNVLRISPVSGEFEYEKPYTLTLPAGFTDIKGGVAEEDFVLTFECVNYSGVIAYYNMEMDKGGIAGAYNTREFVVDDNGNTYLDVYNDRIVIAFDEAATGGTLTVDFDYKNIDVNNNLACSLRFDEDGKYGGDTPSLFKIGGSVGSGDWVKYRVIADIDKDIVDVYRDGIFVETVSGTGLNSFSEIKGIQIERWSTHIGLDNLKVYFGNSGIEGYKFRDFSGNTADGVSKLNGALECIEVEFENEPDADSMNITLYNEKTAQSEAVVLTANGRCLEIRPEKGYFDVSADYILALPKGYTNKYGYVGEDAIEFTFNTGNKVFGLVSVDITKNGQAVSLSNISAGDVLDVEVKYVLNAEGESYDAVVALTTEKASMLTSFGSTDATFSEPGVKTVKYPFTVKADAEFDAVYAYVWDVNTRVPQINCATVK